MRSAILDDGKLQDIYFDGQSNQELERCFFKGKISKVIPGLQTAFVEIGQEKAGFLHISEIDRMLAVERIADVEGSEESYNTRTVKKVMDMRLINSVSVDGRANLRILDWYVHHIVVNLYLLDFILINANQVPGFKLGGGKIGQHNLFQGLTNQR